MAERVPPDFRSDSAPPSPMILPLSQPSTAEGGAGGKIIGDQPVSEATDTPTGPVPDTGTAPRGGGRYRRWRHPGHRPPPAQKHPGPVNPLPGGNLGAQNDSNRGFDALEPTPDRSNSTTRTRMGHPPPSRQTGGTRPATSPA
ncbi:hypothetical protein GCM10028793_05470 [Nocardiopsis oceani]